MGMKEWFRQLQPLQLYVILALTVVFFVVELILSHITHALTLLINSYHMLCNIMALTGCIITIKYGKSNQKSVVVKPKRDSTTSEELTNKQCKDQDNHINIKNSARANKENKLKNTFGWARIDVISMLICCVFIASACFSILVEALQTLVHIDHQDEMHYSLPVLIIGCAGLLLNGVCYLLIGGYTFHQGSFLYITESGDVVLTKVVVNDSVQRGERRLSRTRNFSPSVPRQRQGFREMLRDTFGCILVIVCSGIVYFTDKSIAKYVDPVFALISAITLFVMSYPYMKESGLILLQTIPDSININSLKKELLSNFPDIVDIHDFHIWQLTASKVISTVHIIFHDPKVFINILEDVKEFFSEHGITQVTIQPEFFTESHNEEALPSDKGPTCLMACQGADCKENHCCPIPEEEHHDHDCKKGHSHGHGVKRFLMKVKKPDTMSKSVNGLDTLDKTVEINNQINKCRSESVLNQEEKIEEVH